MLQPNRLGAVFERLSIDLTGPHVRSKKGNVYILTVVCPFTKWCECIPLRNKEAVTVARALVEQVFCIYGTPLALLSDRGGEVDGHIMRECANCCRSISCVHRRIIQRVTQRVNECIVRSIL